MHKLRTIIQIRARLHELADELDCRELHDLAEETKRRFSGHRAPAKQRRITEDVVFEVRTIAKHYPDMLQREIAALFGIDQGRVNEILNGYRDGTAYEAHP